MAGGGWWRGQWGRMESYNYMTQCVCVYESTSISVCICVLMGLDY